MSQKTITVVGAGIVGLWQALTLARSGHQVHLIEASQDPFISSASRLAAAMLAPDCESETAPAVVRELGLMALPIWRETVPRIVAAGSLVLASPRDLAELNRFARMSDGHRRIDEAELAALEPDLAGRFASGLFFPHEAHMAPLETLQSLLALLRKAGVHVEFGRSWREDDAAKDDAADKDADHVIVDCRGLAARGSMPQGAPSLRGVRGERLIIRSRDVALQRPVRLLHPRHPLYVVPWPEEDGAASGPGSRNDAGCRYMVGATVIESDDKAPMTLRSGLELLGMAYALHPGFGEAEIVDVAAGVRPAFPDNVPKIVVQGRRIWVNGMYRHGFLTAPALGRLVADYLAGSDICKDLRKDLFVML